MTVQTGYGMFNFSGGFGNPPTQNDTSSQPLHDSHKGGMNKNIESRIDLPYTDSKKNMKIFFCVKGGKP